MPYSIPTVSEFRGLYPEFATTTDPVVQAALDAGARQVDTSWTEGDYSRAIGLYAAHLLSAGAIATSGQEIASERIGPFAVSYFKSDRGWLQSTGYGQQFSMLAGANVPAILVI